MTRSSPDLYQVDRLTDAQVAQFKRDGLLVLPGVLDLDLCRRDRRVGYDGWAVPDDRGQCGGNDHPSGIGARAVDRPGHRQVRAAAAAQNRTRVDDRPRYAWSLLHPAQESTAAGKLSRCPCYRLCPKSEALPSQ